MKKRLIALIFVALLLTGCAKWERTFKDARSSITGLDRVITVYDNAGNELRVYEGKVDVEDTQYGNKVKFELDGKRVIVYNAVVIVEEK